MSDYPRESTIHSLFEEQARLHPDAIALLSGEEQLTYGELNERANRLAGRLRQLGIGPGALTPVFIERSFDLFVAFLGILKTGGAYVPLDPGYPRERLEFMIADTHSPMVVTSADIEAASSASPLPEGRGPDGPCDLAYVMYTSGSTGKPKGVLVEHRPVVRLVKNTNYCQFGGDEVFLQFAPASFDASTFEIWGSLLNGGRLAIMPPGTPSLEYLGQAIRRYEVTTLWLTAGLFHLMVDQRLEDLRPLKQLLAGGDVLSAPHIRKLLAAVPSCTVVNGYGPTEGTTFTCCHVMRAGDPVPDRVPIGRPVSNTRVYILDSNLEPAPVGQPGELCIGGDGLARGYLNDPELTREKFVLDGVDRLYRTGDLAAYRDDGTIDFLGRIDNQVKILGFRVEPGEVETVLRQHSGVQQAAVLARADSLREKRLVAYIVPVPERPPSVSELRDYLQSKLPGYMAPSAFILLDSLPLTANGKLDRAALPAPNIEPAAEIETPAGAESTILEVWRRVLGTGRVGLTDNFFDLGGDSLMLLEAHAELRKVLKLDISVMDLFEFTTIHSLVQHLEGKPPEEPAFRETEERVRKQREFLARRKRLAAKECV